MGQPSTCYAQKLLYGVLLLRSHKSFDKLSPHERFPILVNIAPAAQADRVMDWLSNEAIPLWSTQGVDWRGGGFQEALGFDSVPLEQTKLMRTTARQIHAFSVAKGLGCCEDGDNIIDHGIAFMRKGRTKRGGWGRSFNPDGTLLDATEETYDQACVLLALAHAHQAGHPDARRLGEETIEFLDRYLEDPKLTGFLETSEGSLERRSSSQMRLLEAFLAWYQATGDRSCMRKAADLGGLFEAHFFNSRTWTIGEFFDDFWMPEPERGNWTAPGHLFEWASLMAAGFAATIGQQDMLIYARKLYSFAIASGISRTTGLAYDMVTSEGQPLNRMSSAWSQAEALKASIVLDGVDGQDMGLETEERLARLFRSHIDPAAQGLWIDRVDELGAPAAANVPAGTLHRLVVVMSRYLRLGQTPDLAA